MKKLILFSFLLFSYLGIYSQVYVPFQIRKQENLKGGLKMIGNQILNSNPANNDYNNDWGINDELMMRYVDIDNDDNTFSSSAATLTFDNPTCSKIRYAGLYWGGTNLRNDPQRGNIKIKIPSRTNYIDIEADTFIYDGHISNPQYGREAYICYKDITKLLSDTNPTGEYIIANVRATRTRDAYEVNGGVSAGWSLVIIYEDPDKSSKNISTFDGYASISKEQEVDFSFSGFKTLPAPLPVNARFGVMALEGDKAISGDKLSILKPDGTYEGLFNSVNPIDNFFNSSISENENLITNRRPASTNTLGWDIDLFSVPNKNNSVVENDQETASFKAHSTKDLYNIFFSAFEVEVIEPKMNLLKTVEDAAGNILNNKTVPLGSTIYYGLEFQNVGNDDAIDYQIKDLLPKNVTLDTNIPVEIPTGSGITYSVNGGEITFRIPNNLVKKGGNKYKVRFAIKLSPNCSDFIAPCSEKILNKAKSIYKGTLNQSIINDNGSFSSIDNCNIGVLDDTIFYADLSLCTITENIELLCGENITLTAPSNFDEYEWQDSSGNIIGSNKDVIINKSGRYTLIKRTNNCIDRKEIYIISTIQRQEVNPLIPYANVTFTCSKTQKTFPQIFLCGLNNSKSIDLSSIANIASVRLEKYTGTKKLALNETCPPDDNQWQNISNSKIFSLTEEGIYRLSLAFQNNCEATYYFRVHTSPINPTISKEDIYCKNGRISVENSTSDYEYAIVQENSTTQPTFQESPNFQVNEAGNYSILIRKKIRLEQDCVIKIDNINIKKFEQQLQIIQIQNENCENQNDGSIRFKIFDGKAFYKATLKNNQTNKIETLSNIDENIEISFTNLSPAEYTLTINDSGTCENVYNFSIKKAISLKFNTSNELLCINNVSTSQLTIAFEDDNLNLSQVRYSFNNETAKLPFDKIQGKMALLYPKNLPNGSNRISVFYGDCSFTQTIDFQNINPIKISQIKSNSLPSAIKISVSGGSGNYYFYFNDIYQSSDTYYLRSFDDGYINSDGQEIKKVRVRVEDSLGCVVETVLEEVFHDIKIPNYFTPDGDGINDSWHIKNAQGYSRMIIDIYDRTGRKLKTLTSKDSWDGTLNGKNLPSGDYWYHLQFNEAKDRRTYTGHFTLYR
ncbi:T9SS type B sorting domain-containing protein [Capnocytophaga cynodegmi]|uniref:Gliding motility-associated C-terminal domain-containing protein n=1 Tax=Capnocytophaga cynodegmi TaxID=28189 RepID=A0A0B7HM66_9FLAO|nr:T9SS type B sorting domain-containing protein [Capnocytophaga cynodegmi]CEN37021.1 conserved hypothetical protein [Capnocytophaga cynodegmi]CEN38982.1 conserved hypothetical protein [Capnocytophaga cynodegmi]